MAAVEPAPAPAEAPYQPLHVATVLMQAVASAGASRQIVAATAAALYNLVVRGNVPNAPDLEVANRLQVVEEALVLQRRLHTGHLQSVEIDPSTPAQLRSQVRSVRLRRNEALHSGFTPQDDGGSYPLNRTKWEDNPITPSSISNVPGGCVTTIPGQTQSDVKGCDHSTQVHLQP